MDAILGVGGPRPGVAGGFDLWLPLYMVLGFLLMRLLGGMRLSVATSIAAFAGGTLWAWAAGTIGMLPAAALAVLVAFGTGAIRRRFGRPEARRG